MRAFRPSLAAALLLTLPSGPAAAQDAMRGKLLYLDAGRVAGAGVSCVDCHGGLPGALHGLGKAAGDPAAIAYALGAIQQMTPLRGRLSEKDMADLAAYIAFPAAPSPDPRLATAGPAASPYSAERLEFPEAAAGGAPIASTVRITNRGALPLTLLSSPAIGGPAAADFTLAASDCRAGATLGAGESCSMEIVFQPGGETGLRAATLGLTHDWVRGGAHVALIGRVSAAAPR